MKTDASADVIIFCALLAILSGALLVYLASSQQRLRASSLPTAATLAGWLLVTLGTVGWCCKEGLGVGISAALTTLMLCWVLLPYLAWWRIEAWETDAP